MAGEGPASGLVESPDHALAARAVGRAYREHAQISLKGGGGSWSGGFWLCRWESTCSGGFGAEDVRLVWGLGVVLPGGVGVVVDDGKGGAR